MNGTRNGTILSMKRMQKFYIYSHETEKYAEKIQLIILFTAGIAGAT